MGQTATSCLSSTGELRWQTVLCRSDDVLQIKLEEVVGLCVVVLGAETLYSIKEYAGDGQLLLHALDIEVVLIHIHKAYMYRTILTKV